MVVRNDLDRFNLVRDTIKRLPPSTKGAWLDGMLRDKLVEHKRYIEEFGIDMPEILDWKWNSPPSVRKRTD